ncbi:CBS domain-containing protein [Haloarchaeobius sp. TZWSO28]|uniref:CBS domain-containing protein n=1 Tax=Haloarchaeobius sp. TZWSO28 TaxID=3446119 RepID=UPI003EB6D570
MQVRDVMAEDVVTVAEDATLREAVEQFLRHDVGSAVVMRTGETRSYKCGIVTDTDVLQASYRTDSPLSSLRVADEMSSPVVTVPPDTSVEDALETMRRKRVKHLVVTHQMRVVGVVTPTDVAMHHSEAVKAARRVRARRPDWRPSDG